ncbi:hypothetical protein CLV59_10668 [Chitinophaga dinghuensis]|uniref:Uncharacterized protein n=1 Tax=Chitinophaga dinghuensis TaxID=1539050 RepID=A0A327W266_9BACT|nr:hypothetical protein [Chitinophaga dinghuensis]RAJ79008.1 hypothetical protein CLV59_10668 [Chitinophaga dinghuensis]
MRIYALLMLLCCTISGFAQNTINNYKYVIVPEKFEFSKEVNQYGLNTIAKLLLEQKGFTAFVANEELPADLAANKCNALKAEVVQRKALFVTNLTLILKDCQGNIVYKGKEGKSREKEFGVAYNEALRDAFTSLNNEPYKYNGTTYTTQQVTAVAPVATPAPVAAPTASAPAPTPAAPEVKEAAGTLYAQATANGFQLIDTTPKKVLTMLKTSVPDYFIADNGANNGIVLKKGGEWYFEYYKDSKLISEKLLIKF